MKLRLSVSLASLLTFVFTILFTGPLLAADFNTTCAKFTAPLTGGYCVHVPTGRRSKDIVYHLHGLGGSEADWQDPWYYTQQIRNEWTNHRDFKPTVVSISLGSTWLLAEKNASPYSGLFEAMTQQIIPSIERSLGGLRGRRIVIGESMGGLNATQLALKTRLFNKAAILCAPMTQVSPYLPFADIQAHLEKSSAYQYYKDTQPNLVSDTAKKAIQLVQAFFPLEPDFAKANPLRLATVSRAPTDLYVTAGFTDVYALYEGNEKFVELARRRGFDVEWHPMWGGHCVMDIPSLARFLVQ